MKLHVDEDFKDLTTLIQKIGAKNIIWTPKCIELPEAEIIIEVNANSHPEITKYLFNYPQKLIGAYGKQCLLYIPEGVAGNPPEGLPRFHFKQCRTITDMQNKGRFERYIVTNKTSGIFPMYMKATPFSPATEKKEVKLHVCKNCLLEYNNKQKGYNYSVENFNIELFFKDHEHYFTALPSRNDINMNPNIYIQNWSDISWSYRSAVSWHCERCGVDLSMHTDLLQTHHIDGVKTNTDPKNLMALCKSCHAKQPQHGHMKVTQREKNLIAELLEYNDDRKNFKRFLELR
jgi:hypothetical protein